MSLIISEDKNGIKIKILENLEHIKDLRDFIANKAIQYGMSKEYLIGLKVAIDEIVYNAMTHAYEGKNRRAEADIIVKLNNEFIEIEVNDLGDASWIKDYKLPSFETPEEILSHHGRGIYLTNHYMDKLEITENEYGGTRVKMYKKIK